MSGSDKHDFLLKVIGNAQDLEDITAKFNFYTADHVLKLGVEFDNRHIVVHGLERRIKLCEKKLPKLFDSMDIPYDQNKITYLTDDTLESFVREHLGTRKEDPSSIKEDLETTIEDKNDESNNSHEDEEVEETSEEDLTQLEVEQQSVSEELKEEEPATPKEESVDVPSGNLCGYGVPKLKVEYINPNVMGLRESLFVNIEEHEIKKFFSTFKSRVELKITDDLG